MSSPISSASLRTPFTVESTADEVLAGVDLAGKRVIVTGASSGLGTETARALAAAGAEVTLAVRDVAAGQRAAKAIAEAVPGASPAVGRLDLADLNSVTTFAASWTGPLDVLVNNAGVMGLPHERVGGVESHFAINHLGHFALAVRLHDALAAAPSARIVSVSSLVHMVSPVVFDDLDFAGREYHPALAYGQSKTANILFAVEATRRWAAEGIRVNALHPGVILETNLMRHMPAAADDPSADVPYALKTIPQGAATTALLAGSPLVEGVGGRYFQDNNEAETVQREPFDLELPGRGVAGYALDPEAAERLWDLSNRLTGLKA